MEANIEWIIVLAAALSILAGITYGLYKDVKRLKGLEQDVKHNSYFRYDERVGRFNLLAKKFEEAGVPCRLIYFTDGSLHISGDQEEIKKVCDKLDLIEHRHYNTNSLLPVHQGVVKYTKSVKGGVFRQQSKK